MDTTDMMMMDITVEEYMQKPWSYVVRPLKDEVGPYFHASVVELEGCQGAGETFREACESLWSSMASWFEKKLAAGDSLPEPSQPGEPCENFRVDLPKSLHSRLILEAKQEGVSLGSYALYKLSR
ncbi:MAG: type II toxin-antitoxin system HicB family antitoxin [Synergistaceae bacterium]|jgi:predicted RNase H-like HicB family nuclease|nr:type II toxin-antitoxin system HicB family antitoxin [Synergistaceae bacterium]